MAGAHTWNERRALLLRRAKVERLEAASTLATRARQAVIPTRSESGSLPGYSRKRQKTARREQRSVVSTIPSVLATCGFPCGELDDWTLARHAHIRNIKDHQPRPLREHTPWKVVGTALQGEMPSLESLMYDCARLKGKRKKEMWEGNSLIDKCSVSDSHQWAKDMLSGEKVTKRVLNMDGAGLVGAMDREFAQHSDRLVREQYGVPLDRGTFPMKPELFITPRGTRTEIHHDSYTHVSVAVGRSRNRDQPLKLWIVWPSTQIDKLRSCYMDTQAAFSLLEDGCFWVQYPGDVIVVPPNSPHAVVTLNDCYLYGITYELRGTVVDPSTLCVEIQSGTDEEEAYKRYVATLDAGLQSGMWRAAYVSLFMSSWAADAPILAHWDEYRTLLELWIADFERTGQCVWCEGCRPEYEYIKGVTDIYRHVEMHLCSWYSTSELAE